MTDGGTLSLPRPRSPMAGETLEVTCERSAGLLNLDVLLARNLEFERQLTAERTYRRVVSFLLVVATAVWTFDVLSVFMWIRR